MSRSNSYRTGFGESTIISPIFGFREWVDDLVMKKEKELVSLECNLLKYNRTDELSSQEGEDP